ncbi:uncharacterized protein LOC136040278 [Artemia franciscana]|uniref:uncharacterized protein LOC136040278 n=1 Tax=Artemia franciscana TaxID=6661 RepID=UPI0032DA29A5
MNMDFNYEVKVAALKSYLPLLQEMISRLEKQNVASKEMQLQRMRSLCSVINGESILKAESLNKCETVLKKMTVKVRLDPTYKKFLPENDYLAPEEGECEDDDVLREKSLEMYQRQRFDGSRGWRKVNGKGDVDNRKCDVDNRKRDVDYRKVDEFRPRSSSRDKSPRKSSGLSSLYWGSRSGRRLEDIASNRPISDNSENSLYISGERNRDKFNTRELENRSQRKSDKKKKLAEFDMFASHSIKKNRLKDEDKEKHKDETKRESESPKKVRTNDEKNESYKNMVGRNEDPRKLSSSKFYVRRDEYRSEKFDRRDKYESSVKGNHQIPVVISSKKDENPKNLMQGPKVNMLTPKDIDLRTPHPGPSSLPEVIEVKSPPSAPHIPVQTFKYCVSDSNAGTGVDGDSDDRSFYLGAKSRNQNHRQYYYDSLKDLGERRTVTMLWERRDGYDEDAEEERQVFFLDHPKAENERAPSRSVNISDKKPESRPSDILLPPDTRRIDAYSDESPSFSPESRLGSPAPDENLTCSYVPNLDTDDIERPSSYFRRQTLLEIPLQDSSTFGHIPARYSNDGNTQLSYPQGLSILGSIPSQAWQPSYYSGQFDDRTSQPVFSPRSSLLGSPPLRLRMSTNFYNPPTHCATNQKYSTNYPNVTGVVGHAFGSSGGIEQGAFYASQQERLAQRSLRFLPQTPKVEDIRPRNIPPGKPVPTSYGEWKKMKEKEKEEEKREQEEKMKKQKEAEELARKQKEECEKRKLENEKKFEALIQLPQETIDNTCTNSDGSTQRTVPKCSRDPRKSREINKSGDEKATRDLRRSPERNQSRDSPKSEPRTKEITVSSIKNLSSISNDLKNNLAIKTSSSGMISKSKLEKPAAPQVITLDDAEQSGDFVRVTNENDSSCIEAAVQEKTCKKNQLDEENIQSTSTVPFDADIKSVKTRDKELQGKYPKARHKSSSSAKKVERKKSRIAITQKDDSIQQQGLQAVDSVSEAGSTGLQVADSVFEVGATGLRAVDSVSEGSCTEVQAADSMFEIGPTDSPTVDSVSEVISKESGFKRSNSKDSKKPPDLQAEKSTEINLIDRQNDLLCCDSVASNVSNHSAKIEGSDLKELEHAVGNEASSPFSNESLLSISQQMISLDNLPRQSTISKATDLEENYNAEIDEETASPEESIVNSEDQVKQVSFDLQESVSSFRSDEPMLPQKQNQETTTDSSIQLVGEENVSVDDDELSEMTKAAETTIADVEDFIRRVLTTSGALKLFELMPQLEALKQRIITRVAPRDKKTDFVSDTKSETKDIVEENDEDILTNLPKDNKNKSDTAGSKDNTTADCHPKKSLRISKKKANEELKVLDKPEEKTVESHAVQIPENSKFLVATKKFIENALKPVKGKTRGRNKDEKAYKKTATVEKPEGANVDLLNAFDEYAFKDEEIDALGNSKNAKEGENDFKKKVPKMVKRLKKAKGEKVKTSKSTQRKKMTIVDRLQADTRDFNKQFKDLSRDDRRYRAMKSISYNEDELLGRPKIQRKSTIPKPDMPQIKVTNKTGTTKQIKKMNAKISTQKLELLKKTDKVDKLIPKRKKIKIKNKKKILFLKLKARKEKALKMLKEDRFRARIEEDLKKKEIELALSSRVQVNQVSSASQEEANECDFDRSSYISTPVSCETPLSCTEENHSVKDGKRDPKKKKVQTKRNLYQPTRLSLRGKKSMYGDESVLEIATCDDPEIPSLADQYFQCKHCNYIGKKIVFHYANEHKDTEIPYITLTDEQAKVAQLNVHPPTQYANSIMKKFNIYWIPDIHKHTQCIYCTFKSSRRYELIHHVFKHRAPKNVTYFCIACDYSCEDICDFYDHVTFHTGEYRYRCGYCPNFTISHHHLLKTHMGTLHTSQDQLFYIVSDLQLNNDWLYGYICVNCKFFQISERNLHKHVESHPKCYLFRRISLMKVAIKGNFLSEPEEKTTDIASVTVQIAKVFSKESQGPLQLDHKGDIPKPPSSTDNICVKRTVSPVLAVPQNQDLSISDREMANLDDSSRFSLSSIKSEAINVMSLDADWPPPTLSPAPIFNAAETSGQEEKSDTEDRPVLGSDSDVDIVDDTEPENFEGSFDHSYAMHAQKEREDFIEDVGDPVYRVNGYATSDEEEDFADEDLTKDKLGNNNFLLSLAERVEVLKARALVKREIVESHPPSVAKLQCNNGVYFACNVRLEFINEKCTYNTTSKTSFLFHILKNHGSLICAEKDCWFTCDDNARMDQHYDAHHPCGSRQFCGFCLKQCEDLYVHSLEVHIKEVSNVNFKIDSATGVAEPIDNLEESTLPVKKEALSFPERPTVRVRTDILAAPPVPEPVSDPLTTENGEDTVSTNTQPDPSQQLLLPVVDSENGSVNAATNENLSKEAIEFGDCPDLYPETISSEEFKVPLLIKLKKDPTMYDEMCQPENLIDFFKCLDLHCSYTTSVEMEFEMHLICHEEEEQNHLSCSYCLTKFRTANSLSSHMVTVHRHCTYQCPYCFYRSTTVYNVISHSTVVHKVKLSKGEVLAATPIAPDLLLKFNAATPSDKMKPYPCVVSDEETTTGRCHKIYDPIIWVHHLLRAGHITDGSTSLLCPFCGKLVPHLGHLCLHFSEHGYSFFKCSVCDFENNTLTRIAHHSAIFHPSCADTFQSRINLLSNSAKFCIDGKFELFNLSISSVYDALERWDNRFIGMFLNWVDLAHFLSTFKKSHVGYFFAADPDPKTQTRGRPRSNTSVSKSDVAESPEAALNREQSWKSNQSTKKFVANNEFDRELKKIDRNLSLIKQKLSYAHYAITKSLNQRKPPKLTEIASAKLERLWKKLETFDDKKDDSDDIEIVDDISKNLLKFRALVNRYPNDGKSGRDLYICGNISCRNRSETKKDWQEHIKVCNVVGDNPCLQCGLCLRKFKQLSSLEEHLFVHGSKRFICGCCGYRFPLESLALRHVRIYHRTDNKLAKICISQKESDDSEYIIKALNSDKGPVLQRSTDTLYSLSDFLSNSLPLRPVFLRTARCGHCVFRTKIRKNLVRHLQMHRTLHSKPNTESPVNPMPCLESEEKHFDKMINMALSSNEGEKIVELSSEEIMCLPRFIPENKRFVCTVYGCWYLTLDEEMLKFHLISLHSESSYSCKHCSMIDLAIEDYINHLKFHGPRLYKCPQCSYFHWQRTPMGRHIVEKHGNKYPREPIVIREFDEDFEGEDDFSQISKSCFYFFFICMILICLCNCLMVLLINCLLIV